MPDLPFPTRQQSPHLLTVLLISLPDRPVMGGRFRDAFLTVDGSKLQTFESLLFFGSAHALAPPCRGVRTAGKSERLTDGASMSYEQLGKVPPLLEDFLSPL